MATRSRNSTPNVATGGANASSLTPGTYFNQFWAMYDQVLIRPDIMDLLNGVEILASDGEEDLTTQHTGRPRRDKLSDHLPLMFELNLKTR
jgi:hypothetical protein